MLEIHSFQILLDFQYFLLLPKTGFNPVYSGFICIVFNCIVIVTLNEFVYWPYSFSGSYLMSHKL